MTWKQLGLLIAAHFDIDTPDPRIIYETARLGTGRKTSNPIRESG